MMLILVSSAAIGLGYVVMSFFRRVWLAWIVYAALMLLFVTFGGLFINERDVPDYVLWIDYISPIKFGYEGFMNLYWGEVDVIECASAAQDCVARSGAEVLAYYSLRRRSALVSGLILLAINLAYRLIALFVLMWIRRPSLYVNLKLVESEESRLVSQAAMKSSSRDSVHGSLAKVLSRDATGRRSSVELESGHEFVQMETPRTGPKGAGAGMTFSMEWRKLCLKITVKNATTKAVEEKTLL
ncbi:hypothetical protein PybrP1_002452, partial [[Pythium] brassicae (nom. inval.)]